MSARVMQFPSQAVRPPDPTNPEALARFYEESIALVVLPDGEWFPIRESVGHLAIVANGKLDERSTDKGGGRPQWLRRDYQTLLLDLEAEVRELEEALAAGDLAEVVREAGDIANTAMFVADKAGAL